MRRARVACLAFALGALAATTTSNVCAQTPAPRPTRDAHATIVVLAPAGDRFGARVAAELEAMGFRTQRADAEGETTREGLEATARAASAIAAVRAIPSGDGVEVWIADRVTGKTVLRKLPRAPDGDLDETALRVVELLRASLLEVALPDRPKAEAPVTDAIRESAGLPEIAPERPPRFRASIAPAVEMSPGGFGPIGVLDLRLDYLFLDQLGVGAFVTLPVGTAGVRNDIGVMQLSTVLAGGSARVLLTPPSSSIAPSIDLGFAAVSLRLKGPTDMLSPPIDDNAVTAAPFLRLGVAMRPIREFGLRADVLGAVTTDSIALRLGSAPTATWGRPLAARGSTPLPAVDRRPQRIAVMSVRSSMPSWSRLVVGARPGSSWVAKRLATQRAAPPRRPPPPAAFPFRFVPS